jgi:hypothetical protein
MEQYLVNFNIPNDKDVSCVVVLDTKELKIANVVYGKEAEELYEKVTGKPQVNKSLLTRLDGILSKETGGKF